MTQVWRGPLNPKEAQVRVNLAAQVDASLLDVANSLGMNKGAAAALCVALGVRMLERVLAGELAVNPASLQAENIE